MKSFDPKVYFPSEPETSLSKTQTRLDSDLQSFWEDYSLCDLQEKSPQELKSSFEEYKRNKGWLDLEQARDEERIDD